MHRGVVRHELAHIIGLDAFHRFVQYGSQLIAFIVLDSQAIVKLDGGHNGHHQALAGIGCHHILGLKGMHIGGIIFSIQHPFDACSKGIQSSYLCVLGNKIKHLSIIIKRFDQGYLFELTLLATQLHSKERGI